MIQWIFTFFIALNTYGINYFWCESDQNCVKAYGGCGRYFSVHQRYKELYEAKAHKADRVASCLAPQAIDKKLKHYGIPQCRKKRCLLTLPEDKKEKAKPVEEK